MVLELYPHQAEAIKKMHNGSILTGDVGTGKSITAIAYYYIHVAKGMPKMKGVDARRMAEPKDLYIFTTAKKRDSLEWRKDLALFNLGVEENPQGVKVVIDSWNNIDRYTDIGGAFLIMDEQRLVGSGAWVKSFLKLANKNQWIMLSATPGDTWMDYIPVFVANDYYKNRTEFINRHVEYERFSKYPKVKKYHNVERLEKIRQKLLVDMPYERHTIRKTTTISCDYDKDLMERVMVDRWHVYEQRPLKDIAEMYALMRKIVNSDMSRLGEILKLIEKHPKLIIFYNFNYELEILRTLKTTLGIEVKEWNGQKHEPVPEGDRWLYLVQYTAGSEGWNCTTTDAIAFYSLTYSWRAFSQSKGRTDRLNTPFTELYYYVLRSASKVDQAIWKALMSKKNFNANAWTRKIWEKNND